MSFNESKFKTLVQYACWRYSDNPSLLGRTKLNKVLWLSDFVSYHRSGLSITGAQYVKRQFGPVPRAITRAVQEMESEGLLQVSRSSYHGYEKFQYRANQPDMSIFDPKELDLIDTVLQFVCEQHTAKSISDLSHDHVWKAAADGEEIPYYTVFANQGEITSDEREWARLELQSRM